MWQLSGVVVVRYAVSTSLIVMFFNVGSISNRFFNYSKSPNRGVKQFGIEVDHKVVYMGRLQRHDTRFLLAVAFFSNDNYIACAV